MAPVAPSSEAPASNRLHDLIEWSWQAMAPELRDENTDPRAVLPYLDERSDTFYWELHFEAALLTRTDFLHWVPLSAPASGPVTSPDPVSLALHGWYAQAETTARCHGSTWLELDGPLSETSEKRLQGVSVCLDPRFGTPSAGDPRIIMRSLHDTPLIFERLQRACGVPLRGQDVLADVCDALAACGGTARHLSVMRGRLGAPGKLYAALPKSTFPVFLQRVGWPGDINDALKLAALTGIQSEKINCDLEFSERLSERVGFELFNDPSPALDRFRQAATATAAALGLVSPEQVEALQSWVGSPRKPLGKDVWPTRIRRWFDMKFVAHPGRRWELKVYLGFRLRDDGL